MGERILSGRVRGTNIAYNEIPAMKGKIMIELLVPAHKLFSGAEFILFGKKCEILANVPTRDKTQRLTFSIEMNDAVEVGTITVPAKFEFLVHF